MEKKRVLKVFKLRIQIIEVPFDSVEETIRYEYTSRRVDERRTAEVALQRAAKVMNRVLEHGPGKPKNPHRIRRTQDGNYCVKCRLDEAATQYVFECEGE